LLCVASLVPYTTLFRSMGALLVIPALTARLLANSPHQMVIWAFVIAQIGVTVGLWSSAGLNTSTGLTIVLTMAVLFAMMFIFQKDRKSTRLNSSHVKIS